MKRVTILNREDVSEKETHEEKSKGGNVMNYIAMQENIIPHRRMPNIKAAKVTRTK